MDPFMVGLGVSAVLLVLGLLAKGIEWLAGVCSLQQAEDEADLE